MTKFKDSITQRDLHFSIFQFVFSNIQTQATTTII